MSYKIVIAEDESDIRNNLRWLLTMEGYTVFTASNGADAVDMVQRHSPDIVLSDVMMPQMTGHEVVAAIRANSTTAHIPVVLLTAKADRGDVRDGMNVGADDYLTKPYQREELLHCLQAQLDKASARHLSARRAVAQAQRLSHYDKVTDLPNRAHLALLLNGVLSRSSVARSSLVLLNIGLDNLPQMAQVLGTGAMDEFVAGFAKRLLAQSRGLGLQAIGECTVGRLGDDRFGIFAPEWPSEVGHLLIATALLRELSLPLLVGGEEHFPSISIGLCGHLSEKDGADMALARLDLALGAARGRSGQRIAIQDAHSDAQASAAFRLHNDLHRAVVRQELQAYYQPQLWTADRTLTGFEALMRWQHPELGLVSPAQFIPVAEENGQIVGMGAWMLQEACAQAATMNLAAARPIRMAVNLSLRQFGDPGLESHVRSALEMSGLPPHLLELEITEGTAMLDLQHTLELLRRFKAMGLKLAIDDFGTGYSSLSYLKRFPLDVLKIDQSFVRNICTDKDDPLIAKAIISLAHSLGLSVIAEGVETQAQHDLLLDMGCEEVQGYLYGKPLPLAQTQKWLSTKA